MTTARRPRSYGRLAQHLRKAEQSFLSKELQKHKGHLIETARAIGITRRALYDKLHAYGLHIKAAELRTQYRIQGPRGGRR